MKSAKKSLKHKRKTLFTELALAINTDDFLLYQRIVKKLTEQGQLKEAFSCSHYSTNDQKELVYTCIDKMDAECSLLDFMLVLDFHSGSSSTRFSEYIDCLIEHDYTLFSEMTDQVTGELSHPWFIWLLRLLHLSSSKYLIVVSNYLDKLNENNEFNCFLLTGEIILEDKTKMKLIDFVLSDKAYGCDRLFFNIMIDHYEKIMNDSAVADDKKIHCCLNFVKLARRIQTKLTTADYCDRFTAPYLVQFVGEEQKKATQFCGEIIDILEKMCSLDVVFSSKKKIVELIVKIRSLIPCRVSVLTTPIKFDVHRMGEGSELPRERMLKHELASLRSQLELEKEKLKAEKVAYSIERDEYEKQEKKDKTALSVKDKKIESLARHVMNYGAAERKRQSSQDLFKQQIGELKSDLESVKKELNGKNLELSTVKSNLRTTKSELSSACNVLVLHDSTYKVQAIDLARCKSKSDRDRNEIDDLKEQLASLQEEVANQKQEAPASVLDRSDLSCHPEQNLNHELISSPYFFMPLPSVFTFKSLLASLTDFSFYLTNLFLGRLWAILKSDFDKNFDIILYGSSVPTPLMDSQPSDLDILLRLSGQVPADIQAIFTRVIANCETIFSQLSQFQPSVSSTIKRTDANHTQISFQLHLNDFVQSYDLTLKKGSMMAILKDTPLPPFYYQIEGQISQQSIELVVRGLYQHLESHFSPMYSLINPQMSTVFCNNPIWFQADNDPVRFQKVVYLLKAFSRVLFWQGSIPPKLLSLFFQLWSPLVNSTEFRYGDQKYFREKLGFNSPCKNPLRIETMVSNSLHYILDNAGLFVQQLEQKNVQDTVDVYRCYMKKSYSP